MDHLLSILPTFLLVLVRISTFFIVAPFFSYRTIPSSHKIGFSALLAIVLTSAIGAEAIPIDGRFLLLSLKECIVGISLGLIAYIAFSAIQTAGSFIDFQMGFAIASVIDPQTGVQSPLVGQYLSIFAMLFLLSIDGHHLLINGLYESFQLVPLSQLSLHFGEESFIKTVIYGFSSMFAIALQLSLPIVAAIFLVDVALGIVARTVPQLNIFVVGFPVKIMVTFLLLIIVIGSLFSVMKEVFDLMLEVMMQLAARLGGE
ncbi:flagellar type III secretion system protein FliR [Priestia filamentosa]|uniref:flagellar biosynthetic protein FliR n=1 Tax=Priestia filamentosa TaxID=1402861 RepID=UPI001FB295B7|nr:flagellar biosynthetic protein FliR [Priestia filamentosa]UOE61746.1 flagellar type III secretion system protein FliR [Priestia filamentosa]